MPKSTGGREGSIKRREGEKNSRGRSIQTSELSKEALILAGTSRIRVSNTGKDAKASFAGSDGT